MTMTVQQLIARLQQLPQDMPVTICHPAQCCCGECFLPHDDYSEPDPSIQTTPTCCGGTGEQAVVL